MSILGGTPNRYNYMGSKNLKPQATNSKHLGEATFRKFYRTGFVDKLANKVQSNVKRELLKNRMRYL